MDTNFDTRFDLLKQKGGFDFYIESPYNRITSIPSLLIPHHLLFTNDDVPYTLAHIISNP